MAKSKKTSKPLWVTRETDSPVVRVWTEKPERNRAEEYFAPTGCVAEFTLQTFIDHTGLVLQSRDRVQVQFLSVIIEENRPVLTGKFALTTEDRQALAEFSLMLQQLGRAKSQKERAIILLQADRDVRLSVSKRVKVLPPDGNSDTVDLPTSPIKPV